VSRGGAAPKAAPIGWAFLDRHREEGITIRWQRGDKLAYVLEGQRIGDQATVAGVLDTIPVATTGWADLAEVRLVGVRWVRKRPPSADYPSVS
jgi:hypothetical protein